MKRPIQVLMTREEFAARIVEIREKLNYSQQEFSNHIGVCVKTVYNWEKGLLPRSQTMFRKLREVGVL